jgi:hypothetical protein
MNKGGEIPNDLQDLLDEYRFKYKGVNDIGYHSWMKRLSYDVAYLQINFKTKHYALDNKEFDDYSLPKLKKLFKSERLKQKSMS